MSLESLAALEITSVVVNLSPDLQLMQTGATNSTECDVLERLARANRDGDTGCWSYSEGGAMVGMVVDWICLPFVGVRQVVRTMMAGSH